MAADEIQKEWEEIKRALYETFCGGATSKFWGPAIMPPA